MAETRYFLISSKVTKYTAGVISFTETTISGPPTHKVTWTNEDHISRTYTILENNKPYPGPPKVGDLVKLALSDSYCISEDISREGREKRPAALDGSTPLTGSWFGLRLDNFQSVELTLASGKSIDLSNLPMALLQSLHVDAEGKLAVLLTPAGKVALGLPGLDPFAGSLNDFFRAAGPMGASAQASTTDKKKLKELLLALAAVLD
jgi:hypothetical protein